MDFERLTPYDGLPDELLEWGEQDEAVRWPRLRLREYVVVLVLGVLVIGLNIPGIAHGRERQYRTLALDQLRVRQMNEFARDRPLF
jgi:hypothetical protein